MYVNNSGTQINYFFSSSKNQINIGASRKIKENIKTMDIKDKVSYYAKEGKMGWLHFQKYKYFWFFNSSNLFLLKIKYSCVTSTEESEIRRARISYCKLCLVSMPIFKLSES